MLKPLKILLHRRLIIRANIQIWLSLNVILLPRCDLVTCIDIAMISILRCVYSIYQFILIDLVKLCAIKFPQLRQRLSSYGVAAGKCTVDLWSRR